MVHHVGLRSHKFDEQVSIFRWGATGILDFCEESECVIIIFMRGMQILAIGQKYRH